MWEQRERIAEASVREGVAYAVCRACKSICQLYTLLAHSGCLQYDVSLPLSVYYDLVEVVRERVKDVAKCTIGFGHIGDGDSSIQTSIIILICI